MILLPITLLMGTNTDTSININEIQRVDYTGGKEFLIRPHLKIFYGKPKPRLVIFKRVYIDLLDREGPINEMNKAVNEFKRLGIKVVEVN